MNNYACTYGESLQLSEHFAAREFQCKCGTPHSFIVSCRLVELLEKLRVTLNCSKININSGYRCPAHDKAVGGSGSGQHTKGTAADVVCYDSDGAVISSRTVCKAAQALGFTGIANIDSSYTATHLDVRAGVAWYGDETKVCGTVTTNFNEYFKEGDDMAGVFGIDVSYHNGVIDWNRVKGAGVKYAILRAGYGREASQKDVNFETYYHDAAAAGIPVGAYWYSYATTETEAAKEADTCISVISGKQFEYPIFYDVEERAALNTGRDNVTAMIRAFCDRLEKAGYWAGIYMSRSPLMSYTEDSIRTRYALWVAEYGSRLNYPGSVGLWQRSSTGTIDGIGGSVDLNECYADYPAMVKAAGLNGFSKTGENYQTKEGGATYPGKITLTADFGNGVKYSGIASRV